ncbi:MAG: hypothetical protein HY908_25065 [Myxococcales bacterium]|nr:hypothetical protein [Myxococcales bacterium]
MAREADETRDEEQGKDDVEDDAGAKDEADDDEAAGEEGADEGAPDDEPAEPPPAPERAASRPRRRPPAAPAPKGGTSTRNIVIFIGLVGGLAAAFAIVGQMGSGGAGAPSARYVAGKTYDIALTLTVDDLRELGCAMPGDVGDLHCAFESQANKPSPKGQKPLEDATLLQPYTTVDQAGQILGAGLWAQPALKEKLEKEKGATQSPRFSVDCKFEVKGMSQDAFIRWHQRDGWLPGSGWPVGKLSDCKVSPTK